MSDIIPPNTAASPTLLASSVDNSVNINGRLIPSSSTISLLSLGETEQEEPPKSPQLATKRSHHSISSLRSQPKSQLQNPINQQRHQYYSGSAGIGSPTASSPVTHAPPKISWLSAQLKKTSISGTASSASAAANGLASASATGTAELPVTPESPSLEPTSFGSSPTKVSSVIKRDMPTSISHLSLSSMSENPLMNSRRSTTKLASERMAIKGAVAESPVLMPVQTPGSEICMTPLMLDVEKS